MPGLALDKYPTSLLNHSGLSGPLTGEPVGGSDCRRRSQHTDRAASQPITSVLVSSFAVRRTWLSPGVKRTLRKRPGDE